MAELSNRIPAQFSNEEQPSLEEQHDLPLTRRQLLRTMAAGSVVLVGGTALIACGGSPIYL